MFCLYIQIERDHKIGSLSNDLYILQKTEVLSALEKLGEELLMEEKNFLENNISNSLKEFNQVQQEVSK